jgi:CheY-like chemotaxis protein
MSPPSVLIVDDNPNDIDMVRIAFEMRDAVVQIDAVAQSDQAVIRLHQAVAERRSPDLIILDRHMPRIDGYEVIAAMKGDGLIDHIPVVMLSSSHLALDEQRCVHAGAQAFFRKPESLEELMVLSEHLCTYLRRDADLRRDDDQARPATLT